MVKNHDAKRIAARQTPLVCEDNVFKEIIEDEFDRVVPRRQFDAYPPNKENTDPAWKYCEDKIVSELKHYLANTYGEHYKTNNKNIECFDAWIALGDSGPTFRNTALKYLWRYGKKRGRNKDDLMKALHYIVILLYVDHYMGDGNGIQTGS